MIWKSRALPLVPGRFPHQFHDSFISWNGRKSTDSRILQLLEVGDDLVQTALPGVVQSAAVGEDLRELRVRYVRLHTALERAGASTGRRTDVPGQGDQRPVGPLGLRLIDHALAVRHVRGVEHQVPAPQARVLTGDVLDLLRVLPGSRSGLLVVLSGNDAGSGDGAQIVHHVLLGVAGKACAESAVGQTNAAVNTAAAVKAEVAKRRVFLTGIPAFVTERKCSTS